MVVAAAAEGRARAAEAAVAEGGTKAETVAEAPEAATKGEGGAKSVVESSSKPEPSISASAEAAEVNTEVGAEVGAEEEGGAEAKGDFNRETSVVVTEGR